MTLFPPESSWRPPTEFPSWKGARRVAVDCETCDPDLFKLGPGTRREGSYLVGVSVGIEDGPRLYLPIRHEGGDNLDETKVLRYLREQARTYDGVVVGAHLTYDLDWLAKEGIEFPLASFRDVMIAEPLLDETLDKYSLDAISMRHLGEGKDEAALREAASSFSIDPKAELWKLPARYVGAYAEGDVDRPLRVLRIQERRLEEAGLWPIYELESACIPVFHAMRRLGVPVDEDLLDRFNEAAKEEEASALVKIRDVTGVDLSGDVWTSAACERALAHQGITCERTPTGQPAVGKEWLEGLDDPVAGWLVDARRVSKKRDTFIKGVRKHLTNGRLHCVFNQLRRSDDYGGLVGTITGRPSCAHPNLLNQPIRTDAEWRRLYVADKGALWCKADYAQQEPRLAIHFASLLGLAEEEVARYQEDPDTDCHAMTAEMCDWNPTIKAERDKAKTVYLARTYGMGGAKFCRVHAKLPTRWIESVGRGKLIYRETKKAARADGNRYWEAAGEEGQAILDQFDRKVPYLKALAKAVEDRAKDRGFVTTILGRRCRFSLLEKFFKALNKLIQGSAADQTKKAMVDVFREGFVPYLQVYDELDLPVSTDAEAKRIGVIMEEAVRLNVPSRVDVGTGPNWGEVG